MKKFQGKYRIPSARADWWDYEEGQYFITICTAHRECCFGWVRDSVMVLSDLGEIAHRYWLEIPLHFPHVRLDTFQVMPNHFHGIIIIDRGDTDADTDTDTDMDMDTDMSIVETPKLGVSTNMDTVTAITIKCGGKNARWHTGVLGVIINQYKRKCTIECRRIKPDFSWQERFHDHIIRDGESYERISGYIGNNPALWKDDKFHPDKPDTDFLKQISGR